MSGNTTMSSQISLTSVSHACDTLLANQSIRSICIIDPLGNLIFEKNQKNKIFPLTDKNSQSLFIQSVLDVALKKDFDEQIGLLKYNVSYRDKMNFITIPIFGFVVLISVDPHENCELIANTAIKIYEIIFKNFSHSDS